MRRVLAVVLPLAAVVIFGVAVWLATAGFSLSAELHNGGDESHHAHCHAPIHGAWGHGISGSPDLNGDCVRRGVRLGLSVAGIASIAVLAIGARRLDRGRDAHPVVDG